VCLELQDIIQDNMAELFDNLVRQIEMGYLQTDSEVSQADFQERRPQFVAKINELHDSVRMYHQQLRDICIPGNFSLKPDLRNPEFYRLRQSLFDVRKGCIFEILGTLPSLYRTDSEDGDPDPCPDPCSQVLDYILYRRLLDLES
jgi:hypothetical protein